MAYLSNSQACRVDLGSASLESDHDDRHGMTTLSPTMRTSERTRSQPLFDHQERPRLATQATCRTWTQRLNLVEVPVMPTSLKTQSSTLDTSQRLQCTLSNTQHSRSFSASPHWSLTLSTFAREGSSATRTPVPDSFGLE